MSNRWNHLRSLILVIAPFAAAGRVAAQCLDWSPVFAPTGVGGAVNAMAVFDDGSGPALFVGGTFTTVNGLPADKIAKWNGTSWSTLGSGVQGTVQALAVFDAGDGPVLYVGGSFTSAGGVPANSIARWNGTAWSTLGAGVEGSVSTLKVFDDGGGPALYVGGQFIHAGTDIANNIARWNGGHWSTLGGGIAGYVYTLEVFDSGGGPELIVGGFFDLIVGSDHACNLARWSGSSWSGMGAGANGTVDALAVFDDGSGSELYAGGEFTQVSGVAANRVARWSGATWSPLSSGTDEKVHSLAVFDAGGGPALYVGGRFTDAGGEAAFHVARWQGNAWSTVAGGIGTAAYAIVGALLPVDLGGGAALFAGGTFASAGGVTVNNLSSFDGATWQPIGPAQDNALNQSVRVMSVFDDGSGPALYAAGGFTQAGGVVVNHVAKWDGSQWTGLGGGVSGSVTAMEVFDDGQGAALFVAGAFTDAGGTPVLYLARWNGSTWAAVPAFAPSFVSIFALKVFDDGSGPALFMGGNFIDVGGLTVNNIAKWNGVAWSALGSGVTSVSAGGRVNVLEVHDDGSGPALYAGGFFDTAGGAPAQNIAKWDGSIWSALGSGVSNHPYSMASFDDGGGPALYVGGTFTTAGGAAAARVARWNGTSFSPLSSGMDNSVNALFGFDDGAGPVLYAAGNFVLAGGVGAIHLAQWNGSTWLPLAGGLGSAVTGAGVCLCAYDDGAGGGPDLYAGGYFTYAGTVGAANIAQWRGCGTAEAPFCVGDGTSLACPCGNDGSPGRGCQNSALTGGALLAVGGTTEPDTIVLQSSAELPNALSIFLQGNALISALPFGDGLRCAGGNLKRLYVKNAVGGTTTAPGAGDPPVSTQSATLGDPIAAGSSRYYQTYYRDPNLNYCPAPAGNSWNVTNGVRIRW